MEFRSLREEAKNGGRQMPSERGSLMAAVLQLDSDAFSYSLPGNLKLYFMNLFVLVENCPLTRFARLLVHVTCIIPLLLIFSSVQLRG